MPRMTPPPRLLKTYGPPRLQGVSAIRSEQSASTYPVSRRYPGQDGDSRVPVLIKLTATERHFLNQDSETPIDCQAISLHHQQTIESRSRTHETISHPVQCLHVELFLGLELDKAHRRPRRGLSDGFRIALIVLLRLDVGANILGRHQSNLVTLCP